MRIRLLLKILFLFPGTFLHELSHYIAALVFGRPAGFSVVPRISGDSLIFGSVKAGTRFRVFSSFIAIAPLVWWLVLYLFLAHFRVMRINRLTPGFDMTLSPGMMRFFSAGNLLLIWLAIQLLWAGRLSTRDIRTFFAGLFSLSGLFLVLTISVPIFVLRHFHLRFN